jgi:Holliday junction resolvase RusA-like endonuclease
VKQYKVIPLAPFGKARPRVTRNGTYMPHDYERAKGQLAMLFGPVEVEGAVKLTVFAYHAMPRSWSQKKRREMDGRLRVGKPDADNCIGACMDALFPHDDSRVVRLEYASVYADSDGLYVAIEEA